MRFILKNCIPKHFLKGGGLNTLCILTIIILIIHHHSHHCLIQACLAPEMDRSWHHLWEQRRIPSEKGKVNYLTIQVMAQSLIISRHFFFLTIFITIVTITITVRRVGWTKAAPNVALVFTWTVQVIIKMKITIDVDDVRPVF